jgi:acetyl esterase/lipase
MATYSAQTCLDDRLSVVHFLRKNPNSGKIVLVGSSSGGQLAAPVSQLASPGEVHGVVLRGPVTSSAFSGIDMSLRE